MKIGMRNSAYGQLIIAAVGAFLFVMASVSAQAANPITIGQITSLTGRDAVAGTDVKRGVALALKRVNSGYDVPMVDGGTKKIGPGLLDGRELRVKVADTESRPAAAMDATRQLVNVDNVSVVIGTYSSAVTVATGQYTNSNDVVQIGTGASSPKLADVGPFLFSTIGTDRIMGRKLAEFAYEDAGAKRFTSIVPNNPWGVGMEKNSCSRLHELGGQCVTTAKYGPGKSDYRPIIRATFRSSPQAGFYSSYGTESRLILKQMHELGKVPPKGWYASYPTMWANEISNISEVGDGIKGLRVGSSGGFYQSEYAKAYAEEYGEAPLTAFGGYGYDAAMLVALAIREAESTEPKDIKEALHTVSKDYKGITGSKTVDEHGMQVDERYQPVIFRNGKLVPYGG